MSATAQRRSTTEILDALGAVLLALTWTSSSGAAEAAFQQVRRFDLAALPQALSELLVAEERCCFIIPGDERFAVKVDGPQRLVVTRTLPIALLISDRVIGNRQAALYGGENNPGAYGLLEIALPAVTGQLLDNPAGIVVKPIIASVFDLEGESAAQSPGRACVELDIECTGGTLAAQLAVGPNL